MVAKSSEGHKYSPRAMWVPVFTVHRDIPEYGPLTVSAENTGAPAEPRVDEARIAAFRQAGDKPVFCQIFQGDVTLSDPPPTPR